MTNHDRFLEAFGHMEHRVMGRRLCKFTLRHRFWLEAMESPVVTGGRLGLVDLELAARVCAIPFAELDTRLPAMLARGPRGWERLAWLWRGLRRDTQREMDLMRAYLLDHGCPPETHGGDTVICEDGAEPVDDNPLPGMLGLVTGLMRAAGWEPETVWALSPGEAEWYLAGIFTQRGVDVGIKTAADEAMEEFLKKRSMVSGQRAAGEEQA